RRPSYVEDTVEVDGDHLVPGVVFDVADSADSADASIVDHYVDRAEFISDCVHCRRGRGRIADIARDGQNSVCSVVDTGSEIVEDLLHEVEGRHTCAFVEE